MRSAIEKSDRPFGSVFIGAALLAAVALPATAIAETESEAPAAVTETEVEESAADEAKASPLSIGPLGVFNRPTNSSPISLSADDRLIWSVNTRDNSVSVLRADTNRVLKTIKVGAEPGFVAVLSVDGAGSVSRYAPVEGPLAPLPAHERRLLEGSIVLDGQLGRERVLAFLCAQPSAGEELVARLRAAAPSVRQSLAPLELGLDCAQSSFWFTKVGPE